MKQPLKTSQLESKPEPTPNTGRGQIRILAGLKSYLSKNWIGISILAILTVIFFWPLITNIGSYSPGGDAMFNAWEIRRNQNCILRQDCPDYTDANIFFPHKDTMLYSESQLSAGFVTLPFYWISENPILAYNFLTIVSFFLSGLFMYMLAKRLSQGNEYISTLAGLVFEFAPLKIAAIYHLQNLSIFCLPLAVLLILKFIEHKSRKYLVGLFFTLLYVFYASWVQMVFVMIALFILIAGLWILKFTKPKTLLRVGMVIALAAIATLPLATQYISSSKETSKEFNIEEQTMFSSSLIDYFIPHENTIIGKLHYRLNPGAVRNAYNSDSYSYHGLILYIVAAIVVVVAFRMRNKSKTFNARYKLILTLAALGLAGFIISLGPLLKVLGFYSYPIDHGISISIPMPWLLVDKFIPQLAFIRAIGRASVIFLFALCCLLALLPGYINIFNISAKLRHGINLVLGLFIFIELMPITSLPMAKHKYNYNLEIPAVYKHVKNNQEINNLIVLRGNHGYPGELISVAQAEDVLWAGYHNRNIYNGYSGYVPSSYLPTYIEFKDFDLNDIARMKSMDLRYIIVDKQLSNQKPELISNVRRLLKEPLFEDSRHALFKIK